ncbi:flagellar brake protein [Defluviitalea saccharophila]|uniref:Flagellar brake protein n=1 Tax=Defluviitalea saccharophila TaxID=879970 RepID=A0ABZ2Y4K5_9FIRM
MKEPLSPGLKVEIKRLSFLNNNKSQGFISQIEECVNDKILIIGAPISGGKIVPLKMNTEYMLIIYGATGMYRCNVVIKKSFKKDSIEMLEVERVTSLEKIQRREFFRLECVIPFQFKAGDTWEKGIIKDISGGGIRFITNSQLKTQGEIILRIPLDEEEITLSGKLLIKEASNTELYKYQYRVSFEDIKKSDQDTIIQYIFLQQRKQVRQYKGL